MNDFTPFTGFDPCDGEDPRVTLSRDNPCQPLCQTERHTSPDDGADKSRIGAGDFIHAPSNIPGAQ